MSKFLNLLKAMGFANAGDAAVQVGTSTDTQPRLQIDAGGKHTWGAGGSSAGDTTLYRSAADTLKTDDAFIAAGGLTVKTIEIDPAGATTNQVLTYNGTKFAPANAAGGGSSITMSDTPPASPSAGALWFESDTAKTFIYYDSTWVELSGGNLSSTYTSDTAPANPTVGTLWYETDSGALYVYYDSFWVEIGPGAAYNAIVGSIQAKGDLIVGTGSQAITRQAVGSNGTRLVADSTQTTGVAWASDATNTVIDAKGDLLVGTADNTVARLGVGTNGQILVADSSQTNGVGWTNVSTRNLLYNGAMQIAQRGTSVANITADSYNTADRWAVGINTLGTWTQSVENDAPTGSGFRKSLKMLCTTAKASPTTSDEAGIVYKFEGQDLQSIAKGTSSAQSLTLSFWVKANVTGTYIVELMDDDNSNRHVNKSYTISASGTWEQKIITFPSDTTGAFDNDNAQSMRLHFWLATGTNYNSGSLQTSWGALAQTARAVGQVNLASATNNYWQITGVQLNVGSVATPFEHRSYATELALCQRYYWRTLGGGAYTTLAVGVSQSTTTGEFYVKTPVTMRANPSSLDWANVRMSDGVSGGSTITAISLDYPSPDGTFLYATFGAFSSAYKPAFIQKDNNANGYIGLNAEL